MTYFITSDNGHIEDIFGFRATFETIEEAKEFLKENHEDWTNEIVTYDIGTDNGITWKTVDSITL